MNERTWQTYSFIELMCHFCETLIEGEDYARSYKGGKAIKGGDVQSLDCLDRDVLDPRFGVDICISAW